MREFLGTGHHDVLKLLCDRISALVGGDVGQPRVIVLEGPSGVGKSRVVRELYRTLRNQCDPDRYWPELDEFGGAGTISRDPLPGRKRIGPDAAGFLWPAGALPGFGWWPLRCERLHAGETLDVAAQSSPELHTHLVPLRLAWKQAASGADQFRARKNDIIAAAKEALTEGGLEAASRALASFDITVLGMGTALSWLLRSAQAAHGHWKTRQDKAGEVDLGPRAEQQRRSVGADIATMIIGVAHRQVPGVVVIEDLHLMGAELQELLTPLAVPRKDKPVVVIAMAWPEYRDDSVYAIWKAETVAAGRTQVIAMPDLAEEDLQRIVFDYAPHTTSAIAEEAARRYPNPLTLEAILSSRLITRAVDAAGGALPVEALDARPRDIDEVYRDRFRELEDEIQTALAVAAGCLPDAETARLWPFIRDVVTEAVDRSTVVQTAVQTDAGQILGGIESAADGKAWLVPTGVADTFREALQAHIAHQHLQTEILLPQQQADLRDAVAAALAGRIHQACVDGYFLDATEEHSILSRWLLELHPQTTPDNQHAMLAAAYRAAEDLAAAYKYGEAVATLAPFLQSASGSEDDGLFAIRSYRARWLGKSGRTEDAVADTEALLAEQQSVLGPDHPDTLTTRNDLAHWLGESGRLLQAVTAFQHLLDDELRVLGPDHPHTLTTRHNLAGLLASIGRVEEAKAALEQVLSDKTRILGFDHPDTLSTRQSIASLLGEIGRFDEAITATEELLAQQHRVLGSDDPTTLVTRHNLAVCLSEAGRLNDSIVAREQLLADQKRVLGTEHPDTLTTRRCLADIFGEAGRVHQALQLGELVLADQIRLLGPRHPDTLATRNNLAQWLADAGRLDDAIAAGTQILEDRVQTFGPDHPNTLTTRGNIATCLLQAGRLKEATVAFEALLIDRLRVLGPDHPDTLGTRSNIASCLFETGRVDDAITTFNQLLDDQMRLWGSDHPAVATTRNNLAAGLSDAGHIDDAINILKQLLTYRMRVHGPDHPDTLLARHNLAAQLWNAGRLDEAITALNQLLDDEIRVLGHDSPMTLQTRNNIAASLEGIQAIAAREQLLEDQTRVLGPDHPETIRNRSNLAVDLAKLGRIDEAITATAQVLADQHRVFGPGHPDTISTLKTLTHLRLLKTAASRLRRTHGRRSRRR